MANYSLNLRWTTGHNYIEGNKLADKEAKLALEGTTSEKALLPRVLRKQLKYNKSAANQAKARLKTVWRRD
ncbi:hypothetical protein EI94DRAFT_1563999 [Lactarius quietus]|nr:hypothetical protein EI94DRAFT_1563999 [Lactarius quietus]